jgi:hypothetical protein
MQGEGVTVQSESQAETYTRAVRAHPEVWEGRGVSPAPVAVGETLRLAPCIPDHWIGARPGRPCPRVALEIVNQGAADVVMAALYEHTRPLIPEYLDARTAELAPRERALVTLRVVRALHSEPVLTWLHPPKPEEAPS